MVGLTGLGPRVSALDHVSLRERNSGVGRGHHANIVGFDVADVCAGSLGVVVLGFAHFDKLSAKRCEAVPSRSAEPTAKLASQSGGIVSDDGHRGS